MSILDYTKSILLSLSLLTGCATQKVLTPDEIFDREQRICIDTKQPQIDCFGKALQKAYGDNPPIWNPTRPDFCDPTGQYCKRSAARVIERPKINVADVKRGLGNLHL